MDLFSIPSSMSTWMIHSHEKIGLVYSVAGDGAGGAAVAGRSITAVTSTAVPGPTLPHTRHIYFEIKRQEHRSGNHYVTFRYHVRSYLGRRFLI